MKNKTVNRKAYFEYHILREFTAGIQLVGSEVKSLRLNNFNMGDAFCQVKNGEVFIKNMFIAKHFESTYMNHDERRDRKLLLNKSEIKTIHKMVKDTGITVVPLEMHTTHGRFKLKIGVAQGKKLHDKRESLKQKDLNRELDRI